MMDEEQRQEKIARRGFWENQKVKAKARIYDSPLTEEDGGAHKGEVGIIVEICDGWIFVDFGRGAIICHPDEVE
jgi:hypothetical protein